LLSRQQDECFDSAIGDVMTIEPVTVVAGTKASVAIEQLASRSLSELPVTDSKGVAIGLVDITDVVGW
jgi:CBS domain-containing protein